MTRSNRSKDLGARHPGSKNFVRPVAQGPRSKTSGAAQKRAGRKGLIGACMRFVNQGYMKGKRLKALPMKSHRASTRAMEAFVRANRSKKKVSRVPPKELWAKMPEGSTELYARPSPNSRCFPLLCSHPVGAAR